MGIVVKAESVSKAYQLGEFSTGTLSRDIERTLNKWRGKEDKFSAINEKDGYNSTKKVELSWSLNNVSFEFSKGEAIGIIGRNGAGKSTLLKILSRVTTPTSGKIKLRGKVASLLEVGTGFHPELTGRENIFLNGAILGMTKREVKQKFDEILDFAEVEKYVDTPVKRYSSGMYVRLAFAVAAHLESDILIVDEVLAVGDAEFQKKCLGKMQDVRSGEGRTVLFVSHNMAAVKSLCGSGLVLDKGNKVYYGGVEEALNIYGTLNSRLEALKERVASANGPIQIVDVSILNRERQEVTSVNSGDTVYFEIKYVNYSAEAIVPAIGFYDFLDTPIILCGGSLKCQEFHEQGEQRILLEIEKMPLIKGNYYINLELKTVSGLKRNYLQKAAKLVVETGDFYGTGKFTPWNYGVLVDFNWIND